MQRSRLLWLVVVVLISIADAGAVVAQQNAPGLPTRADVHVMNDRYNAVPVVIVAGTQPSPPVNVAVIGTAMVELTPNAVVSTRRTRQIWEYRQVLVSAGSDPSPALNAAGSDGWEAVGASTAPGGQVIWIMKRPRSN